MCSKADKETDPIFSRNPFMLKGEEWKEKRAEITPAFTNTKVIIFACLSRIVVNIFFLFVDKVDVSYFNRCLQEIEFLFNCSN